MAYCCDGGSEDEGSAQATHDSEYEQEVPVCGADAQQEVRAHQQHRASQDQPAGALSIEDRPDLNAAEEGEEGVDAEDPAYGALCLVC